VTRRSRQARRTRATRASSPRRTLAAFLLLALLLPAPALAGGDRKEEAGIAFHLETPGGDNPKLIFPAFVAGQQRNFRRLPVVSTNDIQSFNPFPSRDGAGYGLLLKLKRNAANRLTGETSNNVGRWMISRINGRPVDAVVIDQPIRDGEIVIWKGVALSEVQALDKMFPRIGERKPRG